MKLRNGLVYVLLGSAALLVVSLCALDFVRYQRGTDFRRAVGELDGEIIHDWEVNRRGRRLPSPVAPRPGLMESLFGPSADPRRVWGVVFGGSTYRVTDQDLRELRPAVNLRALNLESSRVTDDGILFVVCNFPDLEVISLRRTAVTSDVIPHLLKLKNLRYIDLGETGISDVVPLRCLAHLEYLITDEINDSSEENLDPQDQMK